MGHNNVILVGLMGCGKTTIGKNYAKNYNLQFLDLDEYIEKKEGKKITEIFEAYGEKHFRQLEKQAILDIKNIDNYVISTGGGILSDSENLDNLKNIGRLFYLEASVDTLYSRIKDDNKRPLLKCDSPKEKLKSLLEIRTLMYKQADFTINAEKTIDEIIREINEKFKS